MFAHNTQISRVIERLHSSAAFLSISTLMFAMSAHGQTPVPNSPVPVPAITLPASAMSAGTAAEIQKINENMTLLQAQLNQLELRAKIATKQREVSTQSGEAMSSFGARNGNPSVVSVAGLKGSLEAVLVFPGGVTQRVKAGDVIDDRRVARVAVNEVILTDLKGKNVQRLAFGTSATTREAGAVPAAPNSGGMPLPMGMGPTSGR